MKYIWGIALILAACISIYAIGNNNWNNGTRELTFTFGPLSVLVPALLIHRHIRRKSI